MKKIFSLLMLTHERTAQNSLKLLLLAVALATAIALSAGTFVRTILLNDAKKSIPVFAGSNLDDIPPLLRGSRLAVTTSSYFEEPPAQKPPRLCEMPKNYHHKIKVKTTKPPQGYNERNAYVRPYNSRFGALNAREMQAAKIAWHYFETFTQPTTGLANSVGNYPSTTLWDTASYIAAIIAAYELCIIEKPEFDNRMFKLMTTFKRLSLFRNELPNKVYHTKTAQKVDYTNKPGEIGYSALDIGRFLVWMRILKNRYPYFSNTIDSILLQWDFSNVITKEGLLRGARIDKKTGATLYMQEGRLGYEEYAAKGFALWGFRPMLAHRAEPYMTARIFGVPVPYDGRDPRIFHAQNYVVTEGYILDGLELNFDMPHDDSSNDMIHSDGWRAEFADRIYLVQQNRHKETGFLTARSEHNVKGAPYFTYDTIFSDGYAWNTVTPRGDYAPNHAAVSSKAAMGLWALWETDYTDALFDAIIELFDPQKGMYEGLYEHGQGKIEIFTANNNGIILTALLYKVQGKILTPYTEKTEVWFTAFRDRDTRKRKNLPDPPQKKDWLPILRHNILQSENKL